MTFICSLKGVVRLHNKEEKKNLVGKSHLFMTGEIVALGFICLLQFFSPREHLAAFILSLLGMHLGILCFILSKKLFPTSADVKLKANYILEYILLAPYLGLMAAAIAGVSWNQRVKYGVVFGYTGIVALISFFNTLLFRKKLRNEVGFNG